LKNYSEKERFVIILKMINKIYEMNNEKNQLKINGTKNDENNKL
jgi:hypothetical protein